MASRWYMDTGAEYCLWQACIRKKQSWTSSFAAQWTTSTACCCLQRIPCNEILGPRSQACMVKEAMLILRIEQAWMRNFAHQALQSAGGCKLGKEHCSIDQDYFAGLSSNAQQILLTITGLCCEAGSTQVSAQGDGRQRKAGQHNMGCRSCLGAARLQPVIEEAGTACHQASSRS